MKDFKMVLKMMGFAIYVIAMVAMAIYAIIIDEVLGPPMAFMILVFLPFHIDYELKYGSLKRDNKK